MTCQVGRLQNPPAKLCFEDKFPKISRQKYQLVVGNSRAPISSYEPPSCSAHSGSSDVTLKRRKSTLGLVPRLG